MEDVVSLPNGSRAARVSEKERRSARIQVWNRPAQAHDPNSAWLNTQGATGGVAGWPEHHCPTQGRGLAGRGSGSKFSVGASSRGFVSNWSCSFAIREVTRWLQPAQAERGGQNAVDHEEHEHPGPQPCHSPVVSRYRHAATAP